MADLQPSLSYLSTIELLREIQPVTQTVRNRISALNRLMSTLGRTPHDSASYDLVQELDSTLRAVDAAEGFSRHRRADLRSHARWLSEFITARMNCGSAVQRVRPRPDSKFTSALRSALAASGRTKSEVARLAGMSPMTFGDWVRGRHPNAATLIHLRRVEEALGLQRGELARHTQREVKPARVGDPCTAYRSELRARQRDPYRLRPEDLPEAVIGGWLELLFERTSAPTNPRKPRSGWSLKPRDKTRVLPTVLNSVGDQVSPAADVYAAHFLGFSGWLLRAKADGGLGLQRNEYDTIAWLCVPEAVDGYLRFLLSRSHKVHNGLKNFASFIASLTAPEYGQLTARAEWVAGIPSSHLKGRTHQELIRTTFKLALHWRARYAGRNRDPRLPLRSMLTPGTDLLTVMWKGVTNINTAASHLPIESRERACKARDAFLLSLLLTVPLRIETCAALRWEDGAADVLYRTASGYRLRISNVKNRKSCVFRRT